MNETSEKRGDRIAKYLSRAGVCSRRDAEKLIFEGCVKVDGTVLETPAFFVTGREDIRVNNKVVSAQEQTRLFRFHKPSGLVTTARDEKGRQTVFDVLPPHLPRLMSVGRLDLNTEGLLLLTNDGGLARWLELPATGWKRRYRVRAHGRITQDKLSKLVDGIKVDGVQYGSIEAVLEKEQGSNVWMNVTLTEGKNREIRKVMEAIGLQVNRLIRMSYGPYQLGNLPAGEVDEVTMKVIKEQCSGYFKQKDKT